ncbi:hypothetical protein [Endomicrobium proavitum]|uniref:hypothetical protein n=1 Tax=Endomicrobium proavitum TaxID=1408281 RepID=UPI00130DE0A2|nr:hypothetical protein [Endomicrobium proavitum]
MSCLFFPRLLAGEGRVRGMPLTKGNYSKAKHKKYNVKIKTFAKHNRQKAENTVNAAV